MEAMFEIWDIGDSKNMFVWIFLSALFSSVVSYTNIYIFTNLFKVQSSNSKTFKVFLLDSIFNFLCSIFFPAPYYRIINMIIDVILFKMCFKQNFEKSLVGGVINFISIICIEVIFAKIFSYTFNLNYYNALSNYKYFICLMISSSLIRFLIAYYISHYKFTIKLKEHFNKENKFDVIFIAIVSSVFIFFSIERMLMTIVDFPLYLFILEMTLLISYFYLSIKNILKIGKLDELDLKIRNLKEYNKTLKEMYDSVKIIKHNYFNFIQALDGYAQVNDIEGIKTMCSSICKECNDVTNMEGINPKIINNPAIYSIIANKYYLAKENNITMNVEIMYNLKEIDSYIYDLSTILGILLDNAIEATKLCKDKIINLKFVKDYKNDNKLIIVENSYDESELDISKIFEKGYSTKTNNKGNHGLGLWHVKKTISHCDNLEILTSKDKLFCQRIEIYS